MPVARVLALQAQLGSAAVFASPTKPITTNFYSLSGVDFACGDADVKKACRSFERHLMYTGGGGQGGGPHGRRGAARPPGEAHVTTGTPRRRGLIYVAGPPCSWPLRVAPNGGRR